MELRRYSGNRIQVDRIFTPKKQRFADEYLIDLNGTKAYSRAGFKAKNDNVAAVQASRLLREPKVCAYIRQRQEELQKKTGITQERIVAEFAKIGFSNARNYFDKNWRLKPIADLTEEDSAALASFEVFDVYKGRGKNRMPMGQKKRVKFLNKCHALRDLSEHLGIL